MVCKPHAHVPTRFEFNFPARNFSVDEVLKMCGTFDFGKNIKERLMNNNLREWFLSATLAGTLAMGMGAPAASAQNPNEPPPETRADNREDRRGAQQLHQQVLADQQRLQSDVLQFGRRSPQARADRRQLREDRVRMRRVRADRQHDQAIGNR